MFNIIDDPLIRVVCDGRTERLGLSEIFVRLGQDRIESFTAMRPHHIVPWHGFLANLGALAAYKYGAIPETADEWSEAIYGLTDGDTSPWELVVEDVALPAFMQFPLTEPLSSYDKQVVGPDDLDMIIQSRNHSHKVGTSRDGEPDDWLFAMVATQTWDRGLGIGNYGVVKAPAGYGLRAFCGLAPAGGQGAHLTRDICLMVERFEEVAERYGLDPNGVALLWLAPWNGEDQASPSDLSPYFIESCRRLRMTVTEGRIGMVRKASSKQRIDPEGRGGILGDHWSPVDLGIRKAGAKDPAILGTQDCGWTADLVSRLIFGRGGQRLFELPASFTSRPGEHGLRAVFRGVGRDKGKLLGWHEREVPMRMRMITLIGSPDGRDALAEVAADLLRENELILRGAKAAIWQIVSGGSPDAGPMDFGSQKFKQLIGRAVPQIERGLDDNFFEELQDRLEAEKDRRQMDADLVAKKVTEAYGVLMGQIEDLSNSSQRHRILTAAARSFFQVVLSKKECLYFAKNEIMRNAVSRG